MTEQKTVNNLNDANQANALNQVAEAGQSISHEATLFAEPIFHVGQFTVTNSLLTAWVAIFLIIVGSLIIRRKIRSVPTGIQNYVEFSRFGYRLPPKVSEVFAGSFAFIHFYLTEQLVGHAAGGWFHWFYRESWRPVGFYSVFARRHG